MPARTLRDERSTSTDSAVERVIVSASLNADIPSHYGHWFMGRLDAGYCTVPRLDGLQYRRIALNKQSVEGFVFWTRNVGPFMDSLEEVRRRGYAFTIQFAITGYEHGYDPSPIPVGAAVEQAFLAARRFGEGVVVWRYDPIVVADAKPTEWHLGNFERLARVMRGATDEVVIAFERTRRRAAVDPRSEVGRSAETVAISRRSLVKGLAGIAQASALRCSVCAEPELLVPGASPARCIDATRLAKVAGRPNCIPTAGFRPGCLCARAIDMGDRARPSTVLFCGELPRRRRWPRRGPDDEMLYPERHRFARPRDDGLPF